MNKRITVTKGQLILLFAVVLYWISPVDALPLLPFDDMTVVILAWLKRTDLAPALEALVDDLLKGGRNE